MNIWTGEFPEGNDGADGFIGKSIPNFLLFSFIIDSTTLIFFVDIQA